MYFSEIENLAAGLVRNHIEIVYGGSCVGLMGHLADSVLKMGGCVRGVIPEYLNQKGIVHEGLSELRVVGNLLDRKRSMLEGTDAVIAFPGGVGTMDEITEVMALKQLGEYQKPIYFLNFLDSWQPLFDCFYELKERGMIYEALEDLYTSVPTSSDLFKSWNL